jgi:hypothetical protein
MNAPWKVIAAFVGVFIAGAIFGGVFTLRVSAGRPASPVPAEQPLAQLPASSSRPAVAGPQVKAETAVAAPKANPLTPTLMRQLTQKLNLTPDQRDKVRPLVNRASEDFLRLRQENLADNARVTERMYADVSAQLTPAQRSQLETMREEMQQRVQAERKRRADTAAAEAASRVNASPEPTNGKRAPKGP